MQNKKERFIKVVVLTLSSILLFILYIFLNKKIGLEIPCIFYKITGLYCPGCGITRMIISMLKLDFYQAFRYNPLVFIYFPFIIFYLIYSAYKYINGINSKKISKKFNAIIICVLIITICYGVLRNIDMFYYLRPTVLK